MKRKLKFGAVLALAATPALAQVPPSPAEMSGEAPTAAPAIRDEGQPSSPFRPEVLTVRERIAEGPNVFVSQESLSGPGSIAVIGQDDLKIRTLLPTGSQNQMLVSADGKTVYTQSTFMKRIVWGDVEQVLNSYDVATGKIGPEVILPPKAAMALSYPSYLRQTADGALVIVQNATPASSITVVDPAAGKVTQEIPTPGCWGIFPAASGAAFDTVCGDGSFARFALTDGGTKAEKTVGKDVFDPNTDPVFIEGARVGADWLFATYHGKLLRIGDKDGAPARLSELDLIAAAGAPGWAPGGYSVLAVNEARGWAFVGMHPDAYDGSHKNPMAEIWTVDLATDKVIARSPVGPLASITVTQGDTPTLFATSVEGKLLKYTVAADGSLSQAGEQGLTGIAIAVAVAP